MFWTAFSHDTNVHNHHINMRKERKKKVDFGLSFFSILLLFPTWYTLFFVDCIWQRRFF